MDLQYLLWSKDQIQLIVVVGAERLNEEIRITLTLLVHPLIIKKTMYSQ